MMKFWFSVVLLSIGISVGVAIAQNQPRFEHVYTQIIHSKTDETHVNIDLEVIHDKDTGQEIICSTDADHYTGVSCYLTGRNWK